MKTQPKEVRKNWWKGFWDSTGTFFARLSRTRSVVKLQTSVRLGATESSRHERLLKLSKSLAAKSLSLGRSSPRKTRHAVRKSKASAKKSKRKAS